MRLTRQKNFSTAAIAVILALCMGTVVGFWKTPLGSRALRTFIASPAAPTIPPPNNPSKEYIYAGGKLIATEEPQLLAAPLNLTANSLSGSQIEVSWAASPGADHYQVERAPNTAAAYTVVGPSVTGTSFSDTSVAAIATYLYRVRAVDASGNSSSASSVDIATAITFTDDPLTSSTLVKAQHLTELRQAVNAVRAAAGLGAAGWTDSAPAGMLIKATHIQELRTNLDQALSTLGVPVNQYTDSSLSGLGIKKVHIEEIRQRVK
jgi:hypothetical protein